MHRRNIKLRQHAAGLFDRARDVVAAARILDDQRIKAFAMGILAGEPNTEIEGEPGEAQKSK